MRKDKMDREMKLERERDLEERKLTLSEEELAVGKREMSAGEVEIDKDVETRHVKERVPTTREEVVVERRPASMNAKAQIGEEEIHVPVTKEEVIAEKRVVPREEIVASKREVVEEETVEADLRQERANVHRDSAERIPNYDADGDGRR